LMSTDDGGIDHHVFVVGIAAQQLENTLENPSGIERFMNLLAMRQTHAPG